MDYVHIRHMWSRLTLHFKSLTSNNINICFRESGEEEMVICYQNCSDLLGKKIDLVMETKF
jgi:hypothetical protein